MLGLIVNRLLTTAAVLCAVSVVAFGLVHLSGDPAVAIAGEGAPPEAIEQIRRQFGFEPWVAGAVWVDFLVRPTPGEHAVDGGPGDHVLQIGRAVAAGQAHAHLVAAVGRELPYRVQQRRGDAAAVAELGRALCDAAAVRSRSPGYARYPVSW